MIRRLESTTQNQMYGTVTYELPNKRYINFDVRQLRKHGLAALLAAHDLDDHIPTERLPVIQYGRKIGTIRCRLILIRYVFAAIPRCMIRAPMISGAMVILGLQTERLARRTWIVLKDLSDQYNRDGMTDDTISKAGNPRADNLDQNAIVAGQTAG